MHQLISYDRWRQRTKRFFFFKDFLMAWCWLENTCEWKLTANAIHRHQRRKNASFYALENSLKCNLNSSDAKRQWIYISNTEESCLGSQSQFTFEIISQFPSQKRSNQSDWLQTTQTYSQAMTRNLVVSIFQIYPCAIKIGWFIQNVRLTLPPMSPLRIQGRKTAERLLSIGREMLANGMAT